MKEKKNKPGPSVIQRCVGISVDVNTKQIRAYCVKAHVSPWRARVSPEGVVPPPPQHIQPPKPSHNRSRYRPPQTIADYTIRSYPLIESFSFSDTGLLKGFCKQFSCLFLFEAVPCLYL